MISKTILIGHIGKAPEIKRFENNTSVLTFSVATKESWLDDRGEWQEKTEWHNVQVWKNAERYLERLTKGALIYVEGQNRTRSYEKNGVTCYTTEINAQIIKVLSKAKTNE